MLINEKLKLKNPRDTVPLIFFELEPLRIYLMMAPSQTFFVSVDPFFTFFHWFGTLK
jgi:hypothetical protein